MHDDRIPGKLMHFFLELGVVLLGVGGEHLSFFMSLCVCMSKNMVSITPDRKFQISWQSTDREDKGDWGFYSLRRVDEIDYKRPNA